MTTIHVLPLDDDHDESTSCMCGPIPSLKVGDDQIIVHRPPTIYVDPSPFVPLHVIRSEVD